jgi:cytoskeletal protein CcmA (bactofilin family)
LFKKSETPVVAGGKISNVLGPDTSYKGTLKSDGNVRVDGVFEGHIETVGNVIIGPSGKVLADIVASSVQVWGAVRGNITAQGRLEILSTGRVWGDIKVTSMLIDEGGMFRGQCLMMAENAEPFALPTPQVQESAPVAADAKPLEAVPASDSTAAQPVEGPAPAPDLVGGSRVQAEGADAPKLAEAGASSVEVTPKPVEAIRSAFTPRSRRKAAPPTDDKTTP